MSTEERVNRLCPLVDNYMLASLKMRQMINKRQPIPEELANEVTNSLDLLTEEWISQNPDKIQTKNP